MIFFSPPLVLSGVNFQLKFHKWPFLVDSDAFRVKDFPLFPWPITLKCVYQFVIFPF